MRLCDFYMCKVQSKGQTEQRCHQAKHLCTKSQMMSQMIMGPNNRFSYFKALSHENVMMSNI